MMMMINKNNERCAHGAQTPPRPLHCRRLVSHNRHIATIKCLSHNVNKSGKMILDPDQHLNLNI